VSASDALAMLALSLSGLSGLLAFFSEAPLSGVLAGFLFLSFSSVMVFLSWFLSCAGSEIIHHYIFLMREPGEQ
jgi:hypothetical protein